MQAQKIIELIDKEIEDFESRKQLEKDNYRELGIIYTPFQIIDYIVSNIFRIYFQDHLNTLKIFHTDFNLDEAINFLNKNEKVKRQLLEIIKNIRILDPSCGTGRFLVSVAQKLLEIYQLVEPNLSNFEIKKLIIQRNLYAIEIEKSAFTISKLRLVKWLLANTNNNLISQVFKIRGLKSINVTQIIENLNIKFNIENIDFLLEFNSNNFDIIVGNPPYVENKKIKDVEFKKKLVKRYKTAYRLFDLSILFLERSLEILSNNGYLSLILPNKFLSADYGIKIRSLLLEETEIKEILNISSLPVFLLAATYPIILSLKKTKQNKGKETTIKIFTEMGELTQVNKIRQIRFDQKLINHLPSKVIPISGSIELLTFLYQNFKTMAETFNNVKIIYRPFAFLNYRKYYDNISDKVQSDDDLLLIGTGNIEKYHIKFNKRIRILGKNFEISYFHYKPNFKHIWSELNSEKLIFREIAKDLTLIYDPGVFVNVTGLYFIKVPSFNTDQLFILLTILNSQFMDYVFKSLFSTLHMAGGYLRFNGSFIKRLPMPRKFPMFLSHLGRIQQFLSQLKYDLSSDFVKYTELEKFKSKYHNQIEIYFEFFIKLSNSLVKLLFLDDLYLKSNLDYDLLRDLLALKGEIQQIHFKFIIPTFDIKNYKNYSLSELNYIIREISKLHNQLQSNKKLLDQIDNIIKNIFS